jgi:hypothetical protein
LSEVSDLLTEFRVLGDMSSQLEQARNEYQQAVTAIDQTRNPNLAAECAEEPGSSYQQASANNQPLCDALRRMGIVRTELQAWNAFCWMSQMGQGQLWSPG